MDEHTSRPRAELSISAGDGHVPITVFDLGLYSGDGSPECPLWISPAGREFLRYDDRGRNL